MLYAISTQTHKPCGEDNIWDTQILQGYGWAGDRGVGEGGGATCLQTCGQLTSKHKAV